MEIVASPEGLKFYVQVQPRARRDAIEGEHADALKIRLTAPPEDDRANEALVQLLAERLNVPRAAVRIVAGERNRIKRLSIAGIMRAQLVVLLEPRPSRKGVG